MTHFILIGKMKAKPGCEEQLENVLQTLAVGTHTEPGCLFYALHRNEEDPSIFILIEGWASREALDAHQKYPHFLKERPIIGSLIDGTPELTFLTPIGTGEKGNLFFQKSL